MFTHDDFREILAENPVVLFMKGNMAFPSEGQGAWVVQYLKYLDCRFRTIDILQDPDIRHVLRTASNATSPPVLYVNGELIGGFDAIMERFDSGELEAMLSAVRDRP